jgi:major membrane immunogen (membrane-anchored lipoprotein)
MKKLLVICSFACALLITACSKKDARNIIIGTDYTVIAMEDLSYGRADLISQLFSKAPGVKFHMKGNQEGTISDGNSTYKFGLEIFNTGLQHS